MHPGGRDVLLDLAGVDASENFLDVGHSDNALNLVARYKVGEIENSAGSKDKEAQEGGEQLKLVASFTI
jgi:cytochrome b involved in lipid metabolism